jgi:P4 family phage/plasmid primase-like protien
MEILQNGADTGRLLISYTLFPDVWPKTKIDRSDVAWEELVGKIRSSDAYPDKAHCPLVSLCEYGTLLSNSATRPILRHAANVVRAYGAELDYDGELISPERGAAMLEAARLCTVIYTSPSHTPAKPRWRAILPFSEAAPPEKRGEYLARANRALGGIASRESFTLSQSFYIGRVRGADYQVYQIEGRCVDQAVDLEPQYYAGFKANGTHARDETTDEQLRRNIREGHDRHQSCLSLSSRLAAKGMLAGDIEALLKELLGPNSLNADGINFSERAGDYAETAVRKYGESRRPRLSGNESTENRAANQDGVIEAPAPTPEADRIDQLARLDDLSYDRIREQVAKELGARVITLDTLRKERQKTLESKKDKSNLRGPFREPAGFNDTDIANGVRLVKRHGENIAYTAETDWLVWDGKRWEMDPKAVAIQARAKETALAIFDELSTASNRDEIFQHAKRSESKKGIEGMLYMARSEQGIPRKFSEFDTNPWLLNVANGTLDLKTGELHPHDRENLITKLVPIEYYPHAECERWESFMLQSTGANSEDAAAKQSGQELYQYLKRVCGYCLTGEVSEQIFLFLHGEGENGKSVFSEVLHTVLADYAVAGDPSMLMATGHVKDIANDIAQLRGARLCIMNETSEGQKFNEQKLKNMTGGDTLRGEFKYKEAFNFQPTHKLVLRGNHKPEISGRDKGIWRRVQLVPFEIPVPEAIKNSNLLTEIKQNEMSGILKWCVEGCLEWQRLKKLNPPQAVLDAVEAYRKNSDTLGKFIEECCDSDPKNERALGRGKHEKTSTFFKHYQRFCAINGLKWINSNDLPREMAKLGYPKAVKNSGNSFLGISLNLKAVPASDNTRYGEKKEPENDHENE